MTFDDLTFEPNIINERAKVLFDNGYGASIIIGAGTYGGNQGLYELAVLNADTGSINYDTPITDNVVGHLTPERVTELLQQIEALPPINLN